MMLNQTDLLRIFCIAAESPSFREAAARLAISPQSVTRAIQQLEAHFDEVLFHRSTRQIRVTEFGAQLAARARDSLLQLDTLFAPASAAAEPALPTRVRITAPRSLGRMHLLPALARLALAHPSIVVDLRLSDEITDVVDEQIDIGVRMGFMRDNRFVARAVAKMAFVIVGAPALLKRTGAPASPDALAALPTIGFVDGGTGRVWPWYLADDRQFMQASPAFMTDDPEAERDAALAGIGYAQVAHYLAAPHLASGRLVTVLDAFAPPAWDLFVYRPQRGPVPPRIRRVFDAIVEAFAVPDSGRSPS
ncbi:LysR family transcriptional regulator [Duganella sp. CT11-25]|uniref:LysR family transcriptional regulator n=1 Tax=unclassified Duganella TaxID=2636909 RepID=UPI0039AF7ADD